MTKHNKLIRDVQKSPGSYMVVDPQALFDSDSHAVNPVSQLVTLVSPYTGRAALITINGFHLTTFKAGGLLLIKKGTRNELLNLGRNKVPKSQAKHIGLEIECCFPYDKRSKFVELVTKFKLERHLTVTEDGSINPGTGMSALELKLLLTESNYGEVVPKVLKILNDCGAKVNNSCGLHVHLDMRLRSVEECFKSLVQQLPKLKLMVNKKRLKNNYCLENLHDNFQVAKQESRYKMINAAAYSRRRTLEIRMMEGTLDGKRIVNWISTLVSIVNTKPQPYNVRIQTVPQTEVRNAIPGF